MLIGAGSWAVGVCVSPRLKLPEEPIARAAIPLVCGAVMLLVAALIPGEFGAIQWYAVSARSVLGHAYLILFGSVVAFTAYTWLLQHIAPTLVATHTFAAGMAACGRGVDVAVGDGDHRDSGRNCLDSKKRPAQRDTSRSGAERLMVIG